MSGFSPRVDPFPIGTGGTPNWVAGYVPLAVEWNSVFSNKADIDDPRIIGGPFMPLSGGKMTGSLKLAGNPLDPDDAVNKAYMDLFTPVAGPFLSQAGGTMTGPLILSADPAVPLEAATRQYVDGVGTTATTALTVAQAAVPRTGATMTGPLILSQNPTQALGAATKQYVDGFLPLAGGTVTGSVTVNQNLQGNAVYATGALYANAFNGWEWRFTADANGSKFQTYRAGWYDVWSGSTGQRDWVGPGGSLMNLNGSGVLNVAGQVSAASFNSPGNGQFGTVGVSSGLTANTVTANYITSNGNVNAAAQYTGGSMNLAGRVQGNDVMTNSNIYMSGTTDFQIGAGGTGRILAFSVGGGWFLQWSSATGQLDWMTGPSAFWVMRRSDNICMNTLGSVGGNGAYWNFSGIERKRDIEDHTRGVEAIRALRPVSFTRVSPPEIELPDGTRSKHEPRREIGFIAQEVEGILPEAVAALGEDGLALDITPIVASLVNAVRELAAQLDDFKRAAMIA